VDGDAFVDRARVSLRALELLVIAPTNSMQYQTYATLIEELWARVCARIYISHQPERRNDWRHPRPWLAVALRRAGGP
jgi:hypothetical protein